MPVDLELPSMMHKAEQAIGLLNASVVEGQVSWPPPSMRCLACVIHGYGDSEILRVMRNNTELQINNHIGDATYREWLLIPVGRVLEQHPMLDLGQASPVTKKKPQYA